MSSFFWLIYEICADFVVCFYIFIIRLSRWRHLSLSCSRAFALDFSGYKYLEIKNVKNWISRLIPPATSEGSGFCWLSQLHPQIGHIPQGFRSQQPLCAFGILLSLSALRSQLIVWGAFHSPQLNFSFFFFCTNIGRGTLAQSRSPSIRSCAATPIYIRHWVLVSVASLIFSRPRGVRNFISPPPCLYPKVYKCT